MKNEIKTDDVNLWLSETSKKYHLTIEDVKKFDLNKPMNIFLMDRNILNRCCDAKINEKCKSIKPSVFFRNAYFITFTKIKNKDGIIGKWIFNKNPNNSYIKEFDILLENFWYPLKNNKINKEYHQEIDELDKYAGKNINEFSKKTKLGWKGPMMLMQNMDMCNNVSWGEEN